MSIDQLKKIITIKDVKKLNDLLNAITITFKTYKIITILEQSHFLSQVMHESCNFTAVKENLNYSAAALLSTFPKHFNKQDSVIYSRKPVDIGNRAYSNRLGNGDEASGDGFKYCGRGYLQITGKQNYLILSKALSIDLINHPELLELPQYAMLSAGWFWNDRVLNPIADKSGNDVKKITKIINGGYNGLISRQENFDKIFKILSL